MGPGKGYGGIVYFGEDDAAKIANLELEIRMMRYFMLVGLEDGPLTGVAAYDKQREWLLSTAHLWDAVGV